MRWLYAFLDLIFYGNFWIALCASAMVLQTNYLIHAEYLINPTLFFVFGGTLFIYGVHRSVGISNLKDFLAEKRYAVIYDYRNHIRIYAAFGFVISLYFFLMLDIKTQLFLTLPALLAALYVFPFYRNKRLRDINHIKIYLISFVFSILTVLLPNMYLQGDWGISIWLLFFERTLFIFLLTIPFDIRDLKVDSFSKVDTLPTKHGLTFSKRVMWILFILVSLLALISFYLGNYNLGHLSGIILSSLIALVLGLRAKPEGHDYYFTGAIDGIMIVQCSLVLFLGPLF